MTNEEYEKVIDKIETDYGRIFYSPKKDLFMMKRFLKYKPFQSKNLEYVKKLLVNNTKNIIDVGSNIGMNSIEYSTLGKTVYSFEPSPFTYYLLLKNLNENKITNVETFNVGLGENEYEVDFKENFIRLGLSSVVNKEQLNKKNEHIVKIFIKKLDNYNLKNISFIKMDVQGYEYNVLQGATRLIEIERPICQLEMKPQHCKLFDINIENIYDFFRRRNYVCKINTDKFVTSDKHIDIRKTDRFFIPKELIKKNILDY